MHAQIVAPTYKQPADIPNTIGLRITAQIVGSFSFEPVLEVVFDDDRQCLALQDSFMKRFDIAIVLSWREPTKDEINLFELKRNITLHSKRCRFCKSTRVSTALEFHRCLDCKTCFEFGAELKTTLADEDPTHTCSLCDKKGQVQV